MRIGVGIGVGFKRRRAAGGGGPSINLSASSLTENSAEGTAVGTLSVSGGTGTYTFTLTDSAGSRFKVAGTNGVNLQAGATNSDYETATFYNVTVHADNGAGSVLDRTFSILILDVDESGLGIPVMSITSGTSVMTLTFSITWPDVLVLGDVVTLQQADNSGFLSATEYQHTITSTDISNGSFGFGNSRLISGTYFFRVKATRSGSDITDWSNAPSITLDEASAVITSSNAINNPGNSVLAHSLTADIPVTWSIAGGVDAAQFEVSGSTLRWLSNGTKNFSSPTDSGANNVYDVTVRATNGSGDITDQAIAVTVQSPAQIANYLGGSVVGGNQILTLLVAMPASGSGRLVVLTNIQNAGKDTASVVFDPTGANVSLAQDVQYTSGNSFSIWSANITPAGGTKDIVITGVDAFEYQYVQCTYAAWFLEGKSTAAATVEMTSSGPTSDMGSTLPGDFIVGLLRGGSNHPDWIGSEVAPSGTRALGTNIAYAAEWSVLPTDTNLILQPKAATAYARVMARFR